MLVKLILKTAAGPWRTFSFCQEDLEQVYEVLRRGDRLMTATVYHKQQYWNLPLEGLNDPHFSNPAQSLRHQWEIVLAQAPCPVEKPFEQRLHTARQHQLDSAGRVLRATQNLVDSTYLGQQGPMTLHLRQHYQLIIDRYSRLVVRLETRQSHG